MIILPLYSPPIIISNTSNRPEDEPGLSPRERQIAADEAGMEPGEAADVRGRRDFFKKAALGSAAIGLTVAGMSSEAHADPDAVERRKNRTIKDKDGNDTTVGEMNKDADETNARAEEENRRKNPGLVEKVIHGSISQVAWNPNTYRDTVGPLLLKIGRDWGYLGTWVAGAEKKRALAEASRMIDDELTPTHATAEVKAWVDLFEATSKTLLARRAKGATSVTDGIIALNALEAVVNRTPRALMSGQFAVAISTLALNVPILKSLITANYKSLSGDSKRYDDMTAGHARITKEAATRASASILPAEAAERSAADTFGTSSVPDTPDAPDPGDAARESFVGKIAGIFTGGAGWVKDHWPNWLKFGRGASPEVPADTTPTDTDDDNSGSDEIARIIIHPTSDDDGVYL